MYVHCWGGHGRAGGLVCLLLYHLYSLDAAQALFRCQFTHDCRRLPIVVGSPQTQTQRDQVVRVIGRAIALDARAARVASDTAKRHLRDNVVTHFEVDDLANGATTERATPRDSSRDDDDDAPAASPLSCEEYDDDGRDSPPRDARFAKKPSLDVPKRPLLAPLEAAAPPPPRLGDVAERRASSSSATCDDVVDFVADRLLEVAPFDDE